MLRLSYKMSMVVKTTTFYANHWYYGKSSDRTQKLPRREAQTVRLESEHSSRNQPKKKQNQHLTLSWTEEDPEVQRWSSLKNSQQTYLEEICLLLLVITSIQCTFTLLCTQCVQVISLKTIRRTKLPCMSHNNFKPKILQPFNTKPCLHFTII